MKLKRVIACSVSQVISSFRKTSLDQKGFRILLYHSLDAQIPGDSYGISMDSGLFERHIDMVIRKGGIKIVGLEDAIGDEAGYRLVVTFDDGYKDNLYIAAPILIRYGIPFTVFVTTSYIRTHSSLYLSSRELKELSCLKGVTIGSHGVTHTPLAQCSDVEVMRELKDSRSFLEDIIGKPVRSLSYPHGSVDRRGRDIAGEVGYEIGCCSFFGVNEVSSDPLLLRRTEIVANDSERVVLQKIDGAWDWYASRQKDPFETGKSYADLTFEKG